MPSSISRSRRLGLEALEGRCVPAAGFDSTFGTGGTVRTDFPGPMPDEVRDAVVQPDGKIVVVGVGAGSIARASDFAVTRYLANGSLDTGFGKAGHVLTTFPTLLNALGLPENSATAEAVALQSDGKIVVAGTATNHFGLARYNSNGTLDATFGNRGLVVMGFGPAEEAKDVVIQPDGKIVVLGALRPDFGVPATRFALVRFNRDGSLDPTFGQNGQFLSDPSLGLRTATGNRLALQSNGQILVAGGVTDSGRTDTDAVIMRLHANGTLDTDFGSNGMVRTNVVANGNDVATGLVIQKDGQIVITGSTGTGPELDVFAARFTSTGAVDVTYGAQGQLVVNLGARDVALSAALQADGKVIVAGQTGTETGEADFVLIRLNTDGTQDSTFGSGASAKTSFGGNDQAHVVLVQSDGKIVAAGRTGLLRAGQAFPDLALVRYDRNGRLDGAFGTAGKVITGRTGSLNNTAAASVVQADGKVIVGGMTNAYGYNADLVLVRYTANGVLDTTFGVGGRVTTDVDGTDTLLGLAVQKDGKVVVAGAGSNGLILVRYNTNGTLDSTFGTRGKVVSKVPVRAAEVVALPSGKIVVGGVIPSSKGGDFALARFNANGSVDGTFGTAGVARADHGGEDTVGAMAVDAAGRFLLGGRTQPMGNANGAWALARFTPNGALDTSFGRGGKVTLDFGSNQDAVSALSIMPNGQIVAAGVGRAANGQVGTALARFQPSGALDAAFGRGGKVVANFGDYFAASSVVVRGSQILVGGVSVGANNVYTFGVAQFLRNGTLNNHFGTKGLMKLDVRGTGVTLAFQSKGKLLVIGSERPNRYLNDEDFVVARLLVADDG